jgi:acyl transferase domain-containing protein
VGPAADAFACGSSSFNTALQCAAGYYCPEDIPNPVCERGRERHARAMRCFCWGGGSMLCVWSEDAADHVSGTWHKKSIRLIESIDAVIGISSQALKMVRRQSHRLK